MIAFIRFSIDRKGQRHTPVITVLNLSGRDLDYYKIGVPEAKAFAPVIDTDAVQYGGRGLRTASTYKVRSEGWNGYDHHIVLSLPALSAIVLEQKEV